ncbi:hypothetical protein [Paraburkholderia sp.]|uniref:hypothetical protein n=1 Tax=Paraburkholderia sp. TaxID=1926495 RepID=UPI00345CAB40
MSMNFWKTPARALVTAMIAGGALVGATSAFAQSGPYIPRADSHPQYSEAHMIPVDVRMSIGWHDNRYWDGHRYWEHDEWMHHHPRDPGPPHRHDDRRMPPPQRY